MAIKSEDLYLSIPNASPIFSKLAISSQFKVSLDLVRQNPSGDNLSLYQYLTNCGIFLDTNSTSQKYDFLCSQASLPGSNFDVSEELGSRQGMLERMAFRRLYEPFDLTFYIDDDYNILRMFEEWMNFINPVYNQTNGRYDGSESSQLDAYQERNTYSRFRYPDDYRRRISITKFERNFLKNPNDKNNTFENIPLLTYRFIDAFPTILSPVQMSYQGSTFLQVTVQFHYLRHTVERHSNAQKSVREKLENNQLTQINPLRPRRIGSEITPTANDPNPTLPVGYVSGQPYYGPFHPHDITVRFSSSDVNEFNDTITVKNHRRKTGDMLTYIKDDSATAIESMTIGGTPGLIDRTNYYIIKIDDDTIQLAASLSDANSGIEIDLYTKGSGNYQLYEKTIKMVGAVHLPYPHSIIYDTVGESLSSDSVIVGDPVTEVNPPAQEQEQEQEQGGQQGGQEQQQDTTAPSAPSNLSIATGASDNTPTVTGSAEANSTVKLFNGSALLASTTTNSSGSFSVTVSSALSNGTYTFTLTATDAANNVSNSSSISHTINYTPPSGGGGGGSPY